MKKILFALIVIVVLLTSTLFAYHHLRSELMTFDNDDQGSVDPEVAQIWSNVNINSSTVNILKKSFETNKDNTVISGLSLDFSVGMLANGVKGQSLEDLTNFLETSIEDKTKELQEKAQHLPRTLQISNSIWGNEFKKTYKSLIENTFKASAQPLPANTDVIDKWIKKKTHGKIKELLGSNPTAPSDLFLVNTVYFKDKWEDPFKKENTRRKTFHAFFGNDKKVEMMFKHDDILYAENFELQSVKLPYENGGYMIIFLPKSYVNFEEFVSGLSADDLQLNYTEKDVKLYLPKFKIEQETNIKNLFSSMGIKEMFNPNTMDLADISTRENIYIADIKQKAVVEVDESGTVAAAATEVEMKMGCAFCEPPPAIEFVADRPFLFFISQGDFIGFYTGSEK